MTTAYLTVDDTPTEALPAKLDVLDDHGVPAVLFCEGRRIEECPTHATRAIEAGYDLGNHAYSHSHASDLSVAAFREEVTRTDALIDDAYDRTGVSRPAKLFRFPYGDRGGDRAAAFQRVLATGGFTPPASDALASGRYAGEYGEGRDWAWTVSLDDWAVETPAELRARVEAATNPFDGDAADLVLFHDAGNDPALFEALLELLADRGVSFGDPLALLD